MFFIKYFRGLLLYAFIGIFSSTFAIAADLNALTNLFHSSFNSPIYHEGRAWDNVHNFITLAIKNNYNLENARFITLENTTGANYGFVGALKARNQGKLTNINDKYSLREPGEANWSYHAILIAEGMVFDFDFTNEPRLLKISDYFSKMYIAENKQNDDNYVFNKFANYEIKEYSINTEFTQNNLQFINKMNLNNFLNKQYLLK